MLDMQIVENFSGRKILIEDAHVNVREVLNAFDKVLGQEDYLVVEDSDSKQEIIEQFVSGVGGKYLVDQFYVDFFGTNITCSTNSIFKVC